jgi:glycosyltransferase involved in cell wall biosynthesis
MEASVIAPVLNERDNVEAMVASLLAQTRPPAEIVVADGGSTDGTLEILEELAGRHPVLRVIPGPGGRGENRNAAIAAATHDLIACTDAGCEAEPEWLDSLVRPLEAGESWVAGFYRPVGPNLRSTSAGLALMSVLEEVDAGRFLPAGNSQAFHRKVWEAVGGFPEGMEAAEDTLFGERALAAGFTPYFAGKAVVRWTPPPGILAMASKAFRWGGADAAAGLRAAIYKRVLLLYWGSFAAAIAAAFFDWRLGLLALAPLAFQVAGRTRFKYRWARGWPKYVLIPLAHTVQLLSQSLGWLVVKLRRRLKR